MENEKPQTETNETKSEDGHTEGTVKTLTPEQLALKNRIKGTNASIQEMLKAGEELGLKMVIMARDDENDMEGIWKSENVKYFDELGFAKLMESNFV